MNTILKRRAALLVLSMAAPWAMAHVVLAEPEALAGRNFKAALRIGHGCEGSATTGVRVLVPQGWLGAKPQAKMGWKVSVRQSTLAPPQVSHGKTVSEVVTSIEWTATSRETALQDAEFDEFVFLSRLPDQEGTQWIKVLQTCEQGQIDWSETPAQGSSTRGLKSPAVPVFIKTVDSEAQTKAPAHH